MNTFYKILLSVVILFLKSAYAADRVTANFYYHKADSIAHSLLAEPYFLIILRSDSVDSNGKSEYWQYTFQDNDQCITMHFTTDSVSYETGPPWTGSSQIDNEWINSDSALAIAEKDGGKEFRASFPEHTIEANLGKDSALGKSEWEIVYESTAFSNVELTYFINALTGLVRIKWNPKIVSYFPLALDNKWSYYGIQSGDPEGPISFDSVTDSIIIEGRKYFVINYSYFYRSDSIGHVYRYLNNREILWFDFTKAEGDSYFVDLDGGYYYKVTTTHRNTTVKNRAGKFLNCLSLYFDSPDWIDEEFEFFFADNIGVVKKNWSTDLYMELYEANVNGKHYPDTTSKVESRSLPMDNRLFQNFPNPFNPSTTILYAITAAGEVEFNLYNMLGQKIKTLHKFQNAGVHNLDLSAHGLSSGVYIYEIKSGNYVERKKLVIHK